MAFFNREVSQVAPSEHNACLVWDLKNQQFSLSKSPTFQQQLFPTTGNTKINYAFVCGESCSYSTGYSTESWWSHRDHSQAKEVRLQTSHLKASGKRVSKSRDQHLTHTYTLHKIQLSTRIQVILTFVQYKIKTILKMHQPLREYSCGNSILELSVISANV